MPVELAPTASRLPDQYLLGGSPVEFNKAMVTNYSVRQLAGIGTLTITQMRFISASRQPVLQGKIAFTKWPAQNSTAANHSRHR